MSTHSVESVLTWLYVPADRPDRVRKALASSADAVIVDLEDAVAADRKAQARTALGDLLTEVAAEGRPGPQVWVRVQAGVDDDLTVAVHPVVSGVCLPKAESVEGVAAAAARVAALEAGHERDLPTELMLLVETARGVQRCEQLADADERVAILQIGEQDLRADLGLPSLEDAQPEPDPIRFARATVVLASRSAGLAPPVGPVSTVLRDGERIAAETALLRASGFGSRAAIHPDQLHPIRAGLTPSAAEVEWAREVLAADTGGVVAVAGRMVDAPVVAQARRILAAAGR